MKTILVFTFFLTSLFSHQQPTITDLCDLLQKKLETKAVKLQPTKIVCDKYGNIVFHTSNPKSPNEKLAFNLFDIKNNKINPLPLVNGDTIFALHIFCSNECFSKLNWWNEGTNLYDSDWEWDLVSREDADYVIKCLNNIKAKCTKDPNK